MKKRIRIKDVARKAGVSTGTVDRVIHNRGNVSKKARRKVLAALDELGYERNIIASTLAYNRSFRIAVLLPDYRSDLYWAQPQKGAEKAQRAVQDYGVTVEFFFFDLFDPAVFLAQLDKMWSGKPDAILFAPVFLQESQLLLNQCQERQTPNIMINTRIEPADSLAYIGQNSRRSGLLAGRLLDLVLKKGQSALLLNLAKGVANAQHLIDKELGFKQYFQENSAKNIRVITQNFAHFQNDKKLSAFLEALLTKHPDVGAIFVSNSRAYRVAQCLDEAHFHRLKLAGFDLIDSNLEFLQKNKIHFLINQNPVQQGYLGLLNLVNYLVFKQDVAPVQYLPLDIVMKENVEYYLKREESFQMIV